MTIEWTARADGLLYYWRSDDDTLDATVWQFRSRWHWDAVRYQDEPERDILVRRCGVAATADEAQRAAETWIDAQEGR